WRPNAPLFLYANLDDPVWSADDQMAFLRAEVAQHGISVRGWTQGHGRDPGTDAYALARAAAAQLTWAYKVGRWRIVAAPWGRGAGAAGSPSRPECAVCARYARLCPVTVDGGRPARLPD